MKSNDTIGKYLSILFIIICILFAIIRIFLKYNTFSNYYNSDTHDILIFQSIGLLIIFIIYNFISKTIFGKWFFAYTLDKRDEWMNRRK